ncbi:hypothetical protein B4Q13_15655, partial [Lacticaseibacillus rhamnosus]
MLQRVEIDEFARLVEAEDVAHPAEHGDRAEVRHFTVDNRDILLAEDIILRFIPHAEHVVAVGYASDREWTTASSHAAAIDMFHNCL